MYILKLSYKNESGIFREGEFFSGFGMAYRRKYEIFEPVLKTEVNAVGHFSCTVYPSHPLYEYVDKPKSLLEIVRYNVSEPLFIGRAAECRTGLYNEKIITFESELAFLLDSVRTNLFSTVGQTCEYWFEAILNYHNTHAGNFGRIYTDNIQRKFQCGKISESLATYVVQPFGEEFKGTYSTLEIISGLLLEKFGGVLKIRHESGLNYIDWLDEDDLHVCSQKIELSKNLVSIENSRISDELATAIRPVGENTDNGGGESVPLDITLYDASKFISDENIFQVLDNTVNDTTTLKFTDTLYSKSLVDRYGWICREVYFSGVTSKMALVRKAEKYLLGMSVPECITINAADLAMAENSIENFTAGDFAVVDSPVHFLTERKMLITAVKSDLSDPSACKITLGSEGVTLTSQSGQSGSVNASGGFSAGVGGKYDPEGSAASALAAAKKYTDTVSAGKVDKVSGKSLSTNDFTDEYKQQIDANSSCISELKTKTDNTNSAVASLSDSLQTALTQISEKANSDDVYTKTETDSRITSKVSEIVAGAPEEFDTLKEMSDWLSEHEDSAAKMNSQIQSNKEAIDCMAENKADITVTDALAEDISNIEAEKLDKSSGEYVQIRYVSGKKDFNTDFQLSPNEANKVIYFNNDKAIQSNSPFGSEANPYMLIVERIFSSTSVIADIRQTCVYVKSAGSEGSVYVEKQREYKGHTDVWTDWKNCGRTAIESITSTLTALQAEIETLQTGQQGNSSDITALDAAVKNLQDADVETGKNISLVNATANIANSRAESALEKITENISDITINKTTLGYQKKNLLKMNLKTTVKNGVTITVNSDNSVTINGTSSAQTDLFVWGSWASTTELLPENKYRLSIGVDKLSSYNGLGLRAINNTTSKAAATSINPEVVFSSSVTAFYIVIDKGCIFDNYTIYPMLRYADITDSTYEPYTDDVNTRLEDLDSRLNTLNMYVNAYASQHEWIYEALDRFEEQPLLYSSTTSGSSPHEANVTGLFENYSSVICNVVTSDGRYSLTLPLKYIKSLGTFEAVAGKYYQADTLIFGYIDDNTLRIDTGLGQSNPTINSVNIIGLY